METIEPSNDGYWNGPKFLAQVETHLVHHDSCHCGTQCFDVCDNSKGHDSLQIDALKTDKLNNDPGHGRKPEEIVRNGWYVAEEEVISQAFRFSAGDKFFVEIKPKLCTGRSAQMQHNACEIINIGNELIGVLKGKKQILMERNISFTNLGCKVEKRRNEYCREKKSTIKQQLRSTRMIMKH